MHACNDLFLVGGMKQASFRLVYMIHGSNVVCNGKDAELMILENEDISVWPKVAQ